MNADHVNLRNVREEVIDRRFERCKRLMDAAAAGDIDKREAMRDIQEIASGDADPIVRVGGPVVPQIQTGRG